MRPVPGNPYPLGATWDGEGVNFALYSENARGVTLCLIDDAGAETRVPLRDRTAFVWHVYLRGVRPGQRYAYRVHGEYAPERGLRFNDKNLLLDPYAKAVDAREAWDKGLFAYELGHPDADMKKSEAEARGVPLGIVIDPRFDWGDDRPPNTPFHSSIIYETHVRGLTMLHPDVPEDMRGTYGAVGSAPILEHWKRLGVTAVELLPVHAFVDDQFLLDKKLRNYWGYNTIGFFAPDVRYRSADSGANAVTEFKQMVKSLHAAGLEVILDVVYNHTAEGNHLGPSMSFRGIDNPTYYRLVQGDARHYFDYTGTGNSLNVRHPQTLQLIMDSLRYWILDMHVDGFRFDLAATLARSLHDVDQLSSFFTIIHQDPVISQVKLIAEPWDLGEGGYQVGNFPIRWAEWNGKYRDHMRSFWRGEGGKTGELGFRLTGSSDLYENDGRSPYSSLNFIVAHDGFTLKDLVSYDRKHNDANGEGNRDGTDDNLSSNCGWEGPTDDPEIEKLRRRQQRNFLATLLLSQGTPMICGGDEFGRTQGGNNNAYCQDNETSWCDWAWNDDEKNLFAFTERLIAIRREHPALRRAKFFKGRRIRGTDTRDIMWFRSDGSEMNDDDWHNPHAAAIGMYLAGKGIDDVDGEGNALLDDNLMLVLNGGHEALDFVMRAPEGGGDPWQVLVDTEIDGPLPAKAESLAPDAKTRLAPRSLKLFFRPTQEARASFVMRRSEV